MPDQPIAAGRNSVSLLSLEALFARLPLHRGATVLDAACGPGHYSLALARRPGLSGRIYAVDLWEGGLAQLAEAAREEGLLAIRPIRADLGQGLPLDAACLDLCLLVTALHDLIQIEAQGTVLREIARTLKPQGYLAVVEFQKIDPPPGPPKAIRLAPGELQAVLEPFGFRRQELSPLGPHLYLSLQGLDAG